MSDFRTEATLEVVLDAQSAREVEREVEDRLSTIGVQMQGPGGAPRADGGSGIAGAAAGAEVINELNDTNDILEDILDEVEDLNGGGLGGSGGGGGSGDEGILPGIPDGPSGGGSLLKWIAAGAAGTGGLAASIAAVFGAGGFINDPSEPGQGIEGSQLGGGNMTFGIKPKWFDFTDPDSAARNPFRTIEDVLFETGIPIPDRPSSVTESGGRDLTDEESARLASPGAAENDDLTAAERQRLRNNGNLAPGATEANTRAEREAALAGIGATAEERRTIGRTSARGGPTAGADSLTDFNLSPGIATQAAGGGGETSVTVQNDISIDGGGEQSSEQVVQETKRRVEQSLRQNLPRILRAGGGINTVSTGQQRNFQREF